MISEQEFKELSQHQSSTCISIFMPTQRGGKEVLEEKSKKQLHAEWIQIRKELKQKEVSEDIINNIGKPITDLLENRDFWRHMSDGLAIFSSPEYFKTFTTQVNFDAFHHIASQFYIKPLVPALTGNSRFNVLAIQIENVRFYEVTKHDIKPIEIDELTPTRLEERVGFDYKEKALQFRTQGEGGTKTQFHGHGGSERDARVEIKQFFRAVDQGLKARLTEDNLPLLVYCQDYLFPIYKEANTYAHLVDTVIPGNPNDTDLTGLHKKALEIAEPLLNKERDEKIEKYRELSQTENTTSALTDIIPAVYQGKVDTLFLEKHAEAWGAYHEDKMEVKINDRQENGNISLVDLAARKTIEMGGKVYLLDEDAMPQQKSGFNALLRF